MDNGNSSPSNNNKKDGESPDSTGGPIVIPAAAAFVGALIGAVIGSQIG